MAGTLQGKPISNAVCETVDKQGDRRFTHFETNDKRQVIRRHIEGTGKYDGLQTSGDYVTVPFPAIKEGVSVFCNRQTGTYKLK